MHIKSKVNKKIKGLINKSDKRISKSFFKFDVETRKELLENISNPSEFVSFYIEWFDNKKRFNEGKIINDVASLEYIMNKYIQNREEQLKAYINSASNEDLNKLYSKYDNNHPIGSFLLDNLSLSKMLMISRDDIDKNKIFDIQKEISERYLKDGNPIFIKKLAQQDFKQVIPVIKTLIENKKYNNVFLYLLEANYEDTMEFIN